MMMLAEFIEKLKALQSEHGDDVPVVVYDHEYMACYDVAEPEYSEDESYNDRRIKRIPRCILLVSD